MSVPAKSRPPLPSSSDESAVRERAPTGAPPSSGSAAAARTRLEAKLAHARALLASMPAVDDRARLLHIAVIRRDEALLDGVLASLGAQLPGDKR